MIYTTETNTDSLLNTNSAVNTKRNNSIEMSYSPLLAEDFYRVYNFPIDTLFWNQAESILSVGKNNSYKFEILVSRRENEDKIMELSIETKVTKK